jgi:hypothetical protein
MSISNISPGMLKQVDPDGGFLCIWTHWQPNPDTPDSEAGGQKLMMVTYLPCAPDAPCLCGSGKLFQNCCRQGPYMPVICRDPGVETVYSPFRSRKATFSKVDGRVVREKLKADERLITTEDTPARGFWTYWGVPYLESEPGIMCFGDVELNHNQRLVVTALSDTRMQVLLDVVREIIGDDVKSSLRHDPAQKILKPGRKHRKVKRK